MVKRKQIWDTFDKLEGKKEGSSYKNYQKECMRQGYKTKIPKGYSALTKGKTVILVSKKIKL